MADQKFSIGMVYSPNRDFFINNYDKSKPTNMFWGLKELSDSGYDIQEYKLTEKIRSGAINQFKSYFKYLKANSDNLNKNKYIITYFQTGFIVLVVLKLLGILRSKIVLFHYGINEMTLRKKRLSYFRFIQTVRLMNRFAHKIFVLSEFERNLYDKLVPPAKSRFVFIRQGIDTSYYYPEKKDNGLVLIVGNNPNRDWKLVYELAKALPQKKFVVASHTFKADNEIQPDNLIVFNNLSLIETREWFSMAGFLLVQTIPNTHFSGSTTVLAGLASGCIVFMDDDLVQQDYLFENGKNIILYERGNIGQIKQLVDKLSANTELRSWIQKHANELTKSTLNVKIMATDLIDKLEAQ